MLMLISNWHITGSSLKPGAATLLNVFLTKQRLAVLNSLGQVMRFNPRQGHGLFLTCHVWVHGSHDLVSPSCADLGVQLPCASQHLSHLIPREKRQLRSMSNAVREYVMFEYRNDQPLSFLISDSLRSAPPHEIQE